MAKLKTPINPFYFLMQQANAGYQEARDELLEYILSDLRSAKFHNPQIQEFLIHAFGQISNQKMSADKALLLKGKVSGQKRRTFAALNVEKEIAETVFYKRFEKKCVGKIFKKKSLNDCYEEAGMEHNCSPAKAQKAYLNFKDIIEEELDSK